MSHNYSLITNLRINHDWVETTSIYNKLTGRNIKPSTLKSAYCNLKKIVEARRRLTNKEYLTINLNNEQITKFNRFTKVNGITSNKIISNSKQII